LYTLPNIVWVINSKTTQAGHVAGVGQIVLFCK